MGRILQVAFSRSIGETRELVLVGAGHEVTTVFLNDDADLKLLPSQVSDYDVVLLGRDAPVLHRNKVAKQIKQLVPDCTLIALGLPFNPDVGSADINFPEADPRELLEMLKGFFERTSK